MEGIANMGILGAGITIGMVGLIFMRVRRTARRIRAARDGLDIFI